MSVLQRCTQAFQADPSTWNWENLRYDIWGCRVGEEREQVLALVKSKLPSWPKDDWRVADHWWLTDCLNNPEYREFLELCDTFTVDSYEVGDDQDKLRELIQSLPARALAFRDSAGDPEFRTKLLKAMLPKIAEWEGLEALHFWNIKDDDLDLLESLRTCPPSLTHIEVRDYYFQPERLAYLLESPLCDDLKTLKLNNSSSLGYKGAELLAGTPQVENLVHLDLTGTGIGNSGVEKLAESPYFLSLEHLVLRELGLDYDAMRYLADSENMDQLRTLDLYSNSIGEEGAKSLAGSPHFSKLEKLDLSYNSIYDLGGEAIAKSEHLKNLRDLNLTYTYIGSQTAQALADESNLPALEKLEMAYGCQISDEGAKAFAESPRLRFMVQPSQYGSKDHFKLILNNSNMGSEGAIALIQSPHMPPLDYLDLSSNYSINDDFCLALVDSDKIEKLKYLDLSSCSMSNEGIYVILGQESLKESLETFRATGGSIDARGQIAISLFSGEEDDGYHWSYPEWSDVNDVADSPEVLGLRGITLELDQDEEHTNRRIVRRLFADRQMEQLKTFELDCYDFLDISSDLIAALKTLEAPLESVSIPYQELTDAQLLELTEAPWFPGIKKLELSSNQMTMRSLVAILEKAPLLEFLDLDNNRLYENPDSWADASSCPQLKYISLSDNDLPVEPGLSILKSGNFPALKEFYYGDNDLDDDAVESLEAAAEEKDLDDTAFY